MYFFFSLVFLPAVLIASAASNPVEVTLNPKHEQQFVLVRCHIPEVDSKDFSANPKFNLEAQVMLLSFSKKDDISLQYTAADYTTEKGNSDLTIKHAELLTFDFGDATSPEFILGPSFNISNFKFYQSISNFVFDKLFESSTSSPVFEIQSLKPFLTSSDSLQIVVHNSNEENKTYLDDFLNKDPINSASNFKYQIKPKEFIPSSTPATLQFSEKENFEIFFSFTKTSSPSEDTETGKYKCEFSFRILDIKIEDPDFKHSVLVKEIYKEEWVTRFNELESLEKSAETATTTTETEEQTGNKEGNGWWAVVIFIVCMVIVGIVTMACYKFAGHFGIFSGGIKRIGKKYK